MEVKRAGGKGVGRSEDGRNEEGGKRGDLHRNDETPDCSNALKS